MFKCAVCGSKVSRAELVDDVFQIDGEYFAVRGVPAEICGRCGEQSFSVEITEKVRRAIHESGNPTRIAEVKVFDFT